MTIRLLMDCDPGVDDMAALLLALASPELDLIGVTTVAGNVPLDATTANARAVLALAGRADIPVVPGSALPLARDPLLGRHAALGRFPAELVPPAPASRETRRAAEFIADAALAGGGLTICATGPLTNLALALARDERVAAGITRVVVMGGAFTALGYRLPWAEFNFAADPHAAAAVLGAGIPLTLFPLDVTFQALVTAQHLTRLRRGAAAPRALADLFERADRNNIARFGRPGGPIHDAMPIAYLLRPDLFTLSRAGIGVATAGVTKGHSYADFHGADPGLPVVEIARTVDEAGFFTLLMERLAP